MNSGREKLPELPGQPGVVTYTRVPAEAERAAGESPGRAEPRLTATEVPYIAVHPADAIGGAPGAGAAIDIDEDEEIASAGSGHRRPRGFGLVVLIVVVVAAAVLGILVSSLDGTKAPVATVAAPGNDRAAQILSLRQQIEDVTRKAAAAAEDARQKTAELQTQLARLEESAQDASDSEAASAEIRDVTDSAPLPAPMPQPLASADGTVASPEDLPAPAPVVAVVPPVPRPRPDPATIQASLPGTGAPPADLSLPVADDSTYVKSIERILADAPPAAAATGPSPALPLAAPAGTTQPSAQLAPLPVPLADTSGAPADAAPGAMDEDGPIPPEPIPNVAPAQGGVQ